MALLFSRRRRIVASLVAAFPVVPVVELFSDLTEDETAVISNVLERREYKKGEYLFHCGDMGDQLYLVLKGEVDALLPYGKHHYKRLAKFGPGTFFGEVSFLEPGERTADARTIEESSLVVLNQQGLRELQKNHPEIAVTILVQLGQVLSDHLRWADIELRRLID